MMKHRKLFALHTSRLLSIVLLLTLIPGCFAPQRAVNLRLVDADTMQPLPGVSLGMGVNRWHPPKPGIFPVKIAWPKTAEFTVDHEYQGVLPGECYLDIEKAGYETVRIEPTLLGIQIKNMATGAVSREYQLDEATVVPLYKTASWQIDTAIAAGFLPRKREKPGEAE